MPSALWLVTDAQIVQAMIDVGTWGYPREVTGEEAEGAYWFRFGDSVIWWFEPLPELAGAGLHLCIAPHGRRRTFARPLLEAIRVAACLWGYEQLWVADPPREVEDYCERLGWIRDEIGQRWGVRDG